MQFKSIVQDKFNIFNGNELKNPKFSFCGNYITDGVGAQTHMCDSFGTMTACGGDGDPGAMTVHVNDTYNDGYGNP